VTALSTVALALFTLAYLREVREQRVFDYRQLVLQNEPEVQFGGLQPFTTEGLFRTLATMSNVGGPIEDVHFIVILLCCEPLTDGNSPVPDPSVFKDLAWDFSYKRLGRGRTLSRFIGIADDQRTWLEPALKDVSAPRVRAYLRAEYTRPGNPVVDAEKRCDDQAYWWNVQFNQWMELSPKGNRDVWNTIAAKHIYDLQPCSGSS
jgi:hypothetical protein